VCVREGEDAIAGLMQPVDRGVQSLPLGTGGNRSRGRLANDGAELARRCSDYRFGIAKMLEQLAQPGRTETGYQPEPQPGFELARLGHAGTVIKGSGLCPGR
jgi:hypothetical protein